MSCQIIQLTKCPHSQPVKTRLAERLSESQRLLLHSAMTEQVCQQALAADVGPVRVAVAGDLQSPFCRRLREQFAVQLVSQGEGDLGQRMAELLIAHWRQVPGQPVILVGSDSPAVTADYFRTAAAALQQVPVVFGPALDGGYVLLGLRGPLPAGLLAGIPWSTAKVLAASRKVLEQQQVAYHLLSPLADIDRPEDLHQLAGLPSPLAEYARLYKRV